MTTIMGRNPPIMSDSGAVRRVESWVMTVASLLSHYQGNWTQWSEFMSIFVPRGI